jgi:monofunctional biosynthetic peptidoglycan transglycosylase
VEAARETAARRNRAPRGASTITQQLVKNLFLTTHRSYLRKGVEITLTPLAELVLPKRRILELYLNVVEWGPGVYGVEEAARYHYQRPARRLTREQAARLAALLPAPRRRIPARVGGYAATILERMRALGW